MDANTLSIISIVISLIGVPGAIIAVRDKLHSVKIDGLADIVDIDSKLKLIRQYEKQEILRKAIGQLIFGIITSVIFEIFLTLITKGDIKLIDLSLAYWGVVISTHSILGLTLHYKFVRDDVDQIIRKNFIVKEDNQNASSICLL